MATPLIHTMGIIVSEVNVQRTKKEKPYVNVPVYLNLYVPMQGRTKLEVYATFWNEHALRIEKMAKEHKNKNDELTNGKNMPVFLVGYPYTKEYNGKKSNQFYVLDVLYNEVPVLHGTANLGKEVTVDYKDIKDEKGVALTENLLFMNGYIPGVGKDQKLQLNATFWRDQATRLEKMAKDHKNKEGQETNGKGMPIEFVAYEYTDQYTDGEGKEQYPTKLKILDFSYSNYGAGSGTVSEQNETAPPAQQEEKQESSAALDDVGFGDDADILKGIDDLDLEAFMNDMQEETKKSS